VSDRWGSDLVVEALTALGVEHVALNPGASLRGLHESLVHAGAPELILTLHEEVAVAIAHGYVKAKGRPMGVLLHDLVGLQHATMAAFNALVDQAPILLLGGSGPADALRRRPWIDWIHSTRWQSLAVRDVVKWDDQPATVAGVVSALGRAMELATLPPQGPTYVAVDALLQEEPAGDAAPPPAPTPPPAAFTAGHADLERAAELLRRAQHPVLLADLTGRSERAYQALIELAEHLAAPVVDLGGRHNFPTGHWADRTGARAEVLAEADVVACLDVRDVRWALSEIDLVTHGSRSLTGPGAQVVVIGLNDLLHTGFLDREAPVHAVLRLVADTALALPDLVELLRAGPAPAGRDARHEALAAGAAELRAAGRRQAEQARGRTPITPAQIAAELWPLLRERPWLVANGNLSGWARRLWDWNRWGCHLGQSGGAGLGYGLGASIGAAVADRGSGRLVVDLQSDGDLLYTPSALWTAANLRLPLLVVVDNNRAYGKDRLHQATVARTRGRGLDDIGVGIDIDDPPVDLAKLAESQGVEGFGPVTDPGALGPVLERAVRSAGEGRPVLVDVVTARGA
jgi:thiamine pyrophosphate-dependent acetolactate synthase large subunit-like protein